MTMTDMMTIDEIVRRLIKHNPLSIYLFGSHAYGVPHKDSDIDLMVVSSEQPKAYYQKLMGDLWDIDSPIEMLVFSADSLKEKLTWNPMINKIVNEGKVLYGQSFR